MSYVQSEIVINNFFQKNVLRMVFFSLMTGTSQKIIIIKYKIKKNSFINLRVY